MIEFSLSSESFVEIYRGPCIMYLAVRSIGIHLRKLNCGIRFWNLRIVTSS